MKHIEDNAQMQVVRWFRDAQAYKWIPDHYILVHANNSTQNLDSYAKRNNWKKRGGMAGIPDLVLYTAKRGFYGLFIELKSESHRPKRYISPYFHLYIQTDANGKETTSYGVTSTQSNVMARLHQQGYQCQVCYSANDAINLIQSYLGMEV